MTSKFEMLTEDEKRSIKTMAQQMGVSVDQILDTYDDPKKLIENINSGTYKVIKED